MFNTVVVRTSPYTGAALAFGVPLSPPTPHSPLPARARDGVVNMENITLLAGTHRVSSHSLEHLP
jgi:hypothetical protein